MDATARARAMFPLMPAEVFDAWLAPLIVSDGWPFITEFCPPSGLWSQYLDGHSIQSIQRLGWQRQQLPACFTLFRPSARDIIKWIIAQHVHGHATPVARIKEGKGVESFFRSWQFVERTGGLHTPVVLIQQPDGYQIMDGNHRVAALFSVRNLPATLDAWIGI